LSFSGRCPETHSLFAKREAKTLIRMLRVPAQSAETIVSAGGAGAEPPQKDTQAIIDNLSGI
jgi:hypothetical protein